MSIATSGHIKKANSLDALDDMLKSIGQTKVAEEAHTEAGGYDGPTTHPVKKEDDRTEEATEGARSKENIEDVREDHGAAGVTGEGKAAAEKAAMPSGQDDVQYNIGTKQRATGEDSQNETDKAKGGKDDGGYTGSSTHPARTDNDEIDGHKWAADINELNSLIEKAGAAGNDLLANVANELNSDQLKQAEAFKNSTLPEGTATADPEKSAAQAGADLANEVMGTVSGHDKQAQHSQVVEDLAQTILNSYARADATAGYVNGFREGLDKSAMGPEGFPMGEQAPEEEMPPGGPPPESGGGEPPAEGNDEEAALMAALAGEGGPPPGAGGPEGGMGMGGEPGLGEPGLGGGPEGGMDMGPEAIQGDELEMLQAALAEAGITPEQLAAAAQAKAASQLKQASNNPSQIPSSGWKPKTAAEAQQLQATIKQIKELVTGT